MSGQQVGSLVGGIIGSYFGPVGYAIGAAIGGAIGGYVDPTIIKGPRLSDATQQTAQDGIPIPFGFGTFPTAGNIIFASPLRERKKEDDGKGTGIVNVTYHYYRSYAIGICQGIRLANGLYDPIAGVLQCKRNGKVVYNTQPDATAEQLAGNGKFLSKARFYLGGEDQLPSAMMESFKGAGNVPAYRGLVYMEVEDEELTEMGGAIPQWEFVVVTNGAVSPFHSEELAPGHLSEFIDENFILTEPDENYILTGFRDGVEIQGDSVSEILAAFQNTYPPGIYPGELLGYSAYLQESSSASPTHSYSRIESQPTIVDNQFAYMVYNDLEPNIDVNADAPNFCPLTPNTGPGTVSVESYGDRKGIVAWRNGDGVSYLGYKVYVYCIGDDSPAPAISGPEPVLLQAQRKRVGPLSEPPPLGVEIPDAPGYYVMPNGEVVFVPTYVEVFGDYRVLSQESPVTVVDDRNHYDYYEQGPALHSSDPNFDNAAFWTPLYNAAVSGGRLPAGWVFGVDYPADVASVFQSSVTDSDIIDRDLIPISQIVAAICQRAGLTPDDYDVSQLTDLVDGFKVATEGSGESFISPLMSGFFFDAGEWDDKIRFIKRGGDVLGELLPPDMCEREGQVIQETELQEVELLRKVHVKAIDPLAGFNVTTQTAERRTSTVKAKGEQTTEIPVVIDHDTQARMADKKMKVGWSEIRRFAFDIPYIFPQYTVTDVIGLTDKKGRRQRIRLMEMGEEVGQIGITEAMLDRQSSYTSNVEGIAHNPPTDTNPGLIGPTLMVIMNIPVLKDQDDLVGVSLAVSGILPAWSGAQIDLQLENSTAWNTIAQVTTPATIGYTITPLLPEPPDFPSVQTLTVFLPDQPSSVDYETLLQYRNRLAIMRPDGTAEIIQFQTAVDLGDSEYRLEGIIRGRYDTDSDAHPAGVHVVVIDNSLIFLQAQQSMIGTTMKLRATSYGTSTDDAQVQSFTFDPVVSQTEWPPHMLTAERDLSDNVTATCILRARLGTDVAPHQSQYFAGIRFCYSDGTDTFCYDIHASALALSATAEHEYTAAQQTTDFGAPPAELTITTYGLNSITGQGPASEAITV